MLKSNYQVRMLSHASKGHNPIAMMSILRCDQEKEIKQNKHPNNGQCCLFIVGDLTGFGHAMTFFKMKNKCQVVLKYKKTDRQGQ